MACNQPDYVNNPGTASVTDAPPLGASAIGNRILIVSDAPERLPQASANPLYPLLSGDESVTDPVALVANTYTLYKCTIPLGQSAQDFRVLINHESHYTQDLIVSIVASLDGSATATVSNMRGNSTQDLVAGGECLAKSQLYGTLDSVTPENAALSQSEHVIWHGNLLATADS